MADITWAMVEDFDAALSTVGTDAQTAILAYVNDLLDVGMFGGEASATVKLLRIYLASHMGTILNNHAGGVSGPVTAQSAGGLSQSYAAFASDTSLGTTAHGQMYLAMIQNSLARAPVLL